MQNALTEMWAAIDAAAGDMAGNPTMRFERAERLARRVVLGHEATVAERFGVSGRRAAVSVVRDVLLRG